MHTQVRLFTGNAHPALATAIASTLEIPLAQARVVRFSDGETFCERGENVRAVDAYIVQSKSSPVNDNLMELLIMADTLKRASAKHITAVIPYYGYARQDRKVPLARRSRPSWSPTWVRPSRAVAFGTAQIRRRRRQRALSIRFGMGLLRGEKVMDMLLLSICLAVAAIPEALPALITIALAMGAKG